MKSRMQFTLFPRNRYICGTTAKSYFPREREKLAKALGAATRVTFHFRVYDRSHSGAVLDFEASQGAFGDELPADAARVFTLSLSGQSPTLAWNNTNMPTLPDDGTFSVAPTLMLVDVAAKVSGGAAYWVDFEGYAVAEYTS